MSADGYPSGRIFRTDIMIICHQNIWTDYDEFKLFNIWTDTVWTNKGRSSSLCCIFFHRAGRVILELILPIYIPKRATR